jgi:hypothetical protein
VIHSLALKDSSKTVDGDNTIHIILVLLGVDKPAGTLHVGGKRDLPECIAMAASLWSLLFL